MSGNPQDFEVVLAANTPSTIEARGKFFGIIVAPIAPLDVQLDGNAPMRRGPGGSIHVADYFSRVILTSAFAQTVRVLIAEFPQDISNISTGGGGGVGSVVSEQPSATITTPADVALAATDTDTIAANASRRRITIGVLSTSPVGVRVKKEGDAGARGLEISPGTFVEIRTTAALDIHNTDAADAATYYVFEET